MKMFMKTLMTQKFMVLLFCLVIFFFGVSLSCAGDNGFATTRQEIINKLTTPKTRSFGRTRGFTPQPHENLRTIVVMGTENNAPVKKTVVVRPDHPGNTVNMKIEFDYDSSAIRARAYPLLDELGGAVTSSPLESRRITIIGHTDSDGPEHYNLKLSMKRAQSVKNFLVGRYRVALDRIRVFGYGEALPLEPNTSAYNKQLNRRVEIQAE